MYHCSRFIQKIINVLLLVLLFSPHVAMSGERVIENAEAKIMERLFDLLSVPKDKKQKAKYECFQGEPIESCTQRPKTKNKKSIKIQLSLHLLDILEVNQKEGTWTVRAFLYSRWKDRRRLKFKPKDFNGLTKLIFNGALGEEQLKRIWTPDLTIINAINRRAQEKTELSINRNGTVVYKEIFTAKIRTKLNYARFPFDEHVVTIEIEPFTEINKSVRLVPAVRKSGNSSEAPDTWAAGEFKTEFTTRPGARFELTTDKPGAWLAPDGANNFSVVTYSLELKRNYVNFLTTKILILFLFALMLWISAIGFSKERLSTDWPWEIVLGIIFFSLGAKNMLPTLPYITLYDLLVMAIYSYAIFDLVLWVAGRTIKTLDNVDLQLRLRQVRVFIAGPLFIIVWWMTMIYSLRDGKIVL